MQSVDGDGDEISAALAADAFESLFSQGDAGVMVVGPEARVLHINRHLRDYLALPDARAAADALRRNTSPPFPHLRRALTQALCSAAPISNRVLCRPGARDGEHAYWSCSILPLADSGGAVVLMRDIGLRKHIERKLRDSQTRLVTALAASNAGTFGKELAAGTIDADDAFRHLWGFSSDEPLDIATVAARIHPDDRDRVMSTLERADREGGRFELEYRICSPQGATRWLSETGLAQGDPPARRLIGACVDVTKRKEAEEALRQADRRKDEFLAMLAHELRNPLAPIRNVVDVLSLQSDALSDSARWGVGVVDRQVAQLTRLVDDLLDLSRITSGRVHLRRETLDLREVVESALENVRTRAQGKDLTVESEVLERAVPVHGDPARLLQMVENLLDNAVKFTNPGGRITISLRTRAEDAVLEVTDTGIGIDPELLPHVFDLFRQADQSLARTQGGLGIGLTLIKRLVELHNGRVRALSLGLGEGSTFTIELPLSTGDNDERPAVTTTTPPAPLRVLIVDDNRDAAAALASLLESIGHRARSVYDGGQALADVEVERPDVVFLDIGLPDIDGYRVAEQLLAKYPDLHLVAITGYGRDEDRARCRAAGFAEHLVKPVDATELQQALMRAGRTASSEP